MSHDKCRMISKVAQNLLWCSADNFSFSSAKNFNEVTQRAETDFIIKHDISCFTRRSKSTATLLSLVLTLKKRYLCRKFETKVGKVSEIWNGETFRLSPHGLDKIDVCLGTMCTNGNKFQNIFCRRETWWWKLAFKRRDTQLL